MKDREQQSNEGSRIDSQAAEWVVKHDVGLSAEEQDTFFQWLAEDPRHGERYARQRQSWRASNLLSEWCPEHSDEPNPDLLAGLGRRNRWFKRGGGLMALAACLAVFLSLGLGLLDRGVESSQIQNAHFATDAYRYEVLSDGTQLDLNGGAEVKVHYTTERRIVQLLSGEVYFTVAKNPDRPFIVEVNGTEVSALGTAFNIRYQSDDLEVVVTEGRIRWEKTESKVEDEEASAQSVFSQEMISGQKSSISAESVLEDGLVVEAIEEGEIDSLLTWRHELLDFESTRLADAVEEFNRRNRVQLIIVDSELNDEPIVATVRSDNLEQFLVMLELAVGVQVNRSSGDEIMLAYKE